MSMPPYLAPARTAALRDFHTPRPLANPDPFGWVGHELGGARVDAVAARGGFSIVYRARHHVFGEPVAIKCLHLLPRLTRRERQRFIRLFLAEGRAMYRLTRRTSSIVQPLSMGADLSPAGIWTPWLMLEWLEGRTLARELRQRVSRGAGPMALRSVVELLAPIGEALAQAHASGVVHRDVAPQNIFLWMRGEEPTSKLLDFGVAKILRGEGASFVTTAHTPRLLTRRFAAPEQLSSAFGAITPGTDVYAFALLLVACICPHAPHAVGTASCDEDAAIVDRAIDPVTRPTPRSYGADISDSVEAVFQRALAVDARMRFQHAGLFLDALRIALSLTS